MKTISRIILFTGLLLGLWGPSFGMVYLALYKQAGQVGKGLLTTSNGATTVASVVSTAMIQQSAYGGGVASVTIGTATTWTGNAHFYFATDNLAIQQIPDSFVINAQTGAMGPIPSGATGTYQCIVPGGVAYFGAVSLTGSITVTQLNVGTMAPSITYTNGATAFSQFAASSASQSASTSWTTLSTYTTAGLNSRRAVIVFNPGTNTTDLIIGTTSGSGVWDVPPGSSVYIPAATGVTLYQGTLSGTVSGIIATEAA